MTTHQLALKDDLQPDLENPNPNQNTKAINYNPTIGLDISQLKKHNSVVPMKAEQNESLVVRRPIRRNTQEESIKFRRVTSRKDSLKVVRQASLRPDVKTIMPETIKPTPAHKIVLIKFLHSTYVITFMTSITIFALFANDIQAVACRPNVDIPFDIVQIILLGLFSIEIILNSIAKADYLWSFFFWLDLIATISLIQDISYIMDPIMGVNGATLDSSKTFQATTTVSKVTSASRATRVLRIIRIVRLIRIVKIYKSIYIARDNIEKKKKEMERIQAYQRADDSNSSNNSIKISTRQDTLNTPKNKEPEELKFSGNSSEEHETKKKENENEIPLIELPQGQDASPHPLMGKRFSLRPLKKMKDVQDHKERCKVKRSGSIKVSKIMENISEENLIKESKISKIITESITKKVIILILLLLLIFPLLSDDFYSDDSTVSYNILAKHIDNDYVIEGIGYYTHGADDINHTIMDGFDENFPVVNVTVGGSLVWANVNYTTFEFRSNELRYSYSFDGFIQITYSILTETQTSGLLNIIRTLFVCFFLALAAVTFEADAQTLVLEPLEVMIEIVENVSKDPINAKNVENLQSGIKATISKIMKKKNEKEKEYQATQYEIMVIKQAIIKISALLAIGFGDAGGEIIKENLVSRQELNPKLRGKTKTAIFGFCDLRNFSEITMALQENTMVFVNEVAEIVHSSVDKFGGATNKNIGDAFLNVWKFYNETPIQKKVSEISIAAFPELTRPARKDNLMEIDPTNPLIERVADMAVLGFLRIILKINKNRNILKYRTNEDILRKIPHFAFNMGFGLHMGYGIEGAIGSSYKIDASYLSPNVNIAARLESATRQFGVSILISGKVYNHLSETIRGLCRFVDCVKVKGSNQPLDLYTIDVNFNVTPQNEHSELKLDNKEKRRKFQESKERFLNDVELADSVADVVLSKSSFQELLKTNKTKEFYDNWKLATSLYKRGEWKEAGEKFTECWKLDPNDGPTKTLYSYLKSNNFTAPDGWKGERELLAK